MTRATSASSARAAASSADLARFFSGDLAQPLDFLLRLLLREPRLGRFLTQAFELGDQLRVRVGLDAHDFALERTRGRFLRRLPGFSVATDVAREIVGLRTLPRIFGFGAYARELRVELRIGVGADTCDFGFELASGGFLRRHARFLRGEFAQRLGFELGLRLCQARFGRFLAQALEVCPETSLGLGADPRDFGLERACGRLVRGFAGLERGLVATLVGFALRLLLCASCLIGFDPKTFEFGGETRVGLGLHACHFGLDRARRGLLRGPLCLDSGGGAEGVGFDLALGLGVCGFFAQPIELLAQARVAFRLYADDFGLHGEGRGVFSGLARGACRRFTALFRLLLRLFVRQSRPFCFLRALTRAPL